MERHIIDKYRTDTIRLIRNKTVDCHNYLASLHEYDDYYSK